MILLSICLTGLASVIEMHFNQFKLLKKILQSSTLGQFHLVSLQCQKLVKGSKVGLAVQTYVSAQVPGGTSDWFKHEQTQGGRTTIGVSGLNLVLFI